MTQAEEDEIIAKAEEIKARAYSEAQAKWKATPDDQKKRPWPRCGDITCNRTLICQSDGTRDEYGRSSCKGFDF